MYELYDYMRDLEKETKNRKARERKTGKISARAWATSADGSASYDHENRMSSVYEAYNEYRNYENY